MYRRFASLKLLKLIKKGQLFILIIKTNYSQATLEDSFGLLGKINSSNVSFVNFCDVNSKNIIERQFCCKLRRILEA